MNEDDIVCVATRHGNEIHARVYAGGTPQWSIRVYRPDQLDFPLYRAPAEVLRHLADNEYEPCRLPVSLAKQLFGWDKFATECPGDRP